MQRKPNKWLIPLARQLQKDKPDEFQKDAERTVFLEENGLMVIRIPNNEVSRNLRSVCEYIDATVKQSLSQLR